MISFQQWFRVYTSRRVLCLLGLGFSSGLPLALTGATLQAWLVDQQIDLGTIGLYSLVGLPYTLKMFWSPLMDRFALPWLGRRRGWIVVLQVLIAFVIGVLSYMDPGHMPGEIALVAMVLAFLSASQDIVIDAYRTDVLEPHELGAGAATGVMGYRLAMLTSGALALILSDMLDWHTVYMLMATLMLLNMIWTFLAPEPSGKEIPPEDIREAVVGPFRAYFSRPNALVMLLFIVLFKLGDALAAAMTTPFLLDLEFSRTDIGLVYKAFGLISTIIGTLIGGAFVARIGLNRSLWIFAFLQALSNFSFTLLALTGKSYLLMVISIAVENLCGGMGTAGFVAFLMSLCDRRFTATQYAMLTSLMGITRVFLSAATGFMAEFYGWPLFYALTVLGAFPAIFLLPRFAPWTLINRFNLKPTD
ncbi:AmpG family muropeptide MFS transporter [bacterium]|nr:AmpG family muropeptide MFS transporter [bacterium]